MPLPSLSLSLLPSLHLSLSTVLAGELYEKEKRQTEEELQPLQQLLAETEARSQDVQRKCLSLQSTLARNESRLQDLVRMVALK